MTSLTGSRVPVEPKAPENWDDEQGTIVDSAENPDETAATAGEFYFLLEENDISVDELYEDTGSDDLILFYESDAESPGESDEEIGLIYRIFKDGFIARGGDVNYLYTEIVPESRFDGQVGGWAVNSQWAEQHAAGEANPLKVWNKIADTKVYDDESANETNASGTSNETATTTDRNASDESESDAESSSGSENDSDETANEE
ncbi:hypothetical protein [Halopiger xanaduensis]|uniref:DUF8159 domain-containing protein n=1 Tax=Halopiger xanaduensis (strain DSM 18323 / JCM 14033 / SH-6) TaxID=797210 RepID=F8DA72_HALXS|nr:hypothetical protein [Halopiger xanaduensis]AEH38144.1 hypothetical protein Halxa_3533 [Halopiger xanaduensis SH-6]